MNREYPQSPQDIGAKILQLVTDKAAMAADHSTITTNDLEKESIYKSKRYMYLISAINSCSYLQREFFRESNGYHNNHDEIKGIDPQSSVLEIGLQKMLLELYSDEAIFEISETLLTYIRKLRQPTENTPHPKERWEITYGVYEYLRQQLPPTNIGEQNQNKTISP